MLETHRRAALMPNEPGVTWHHFLGGRFTDGAFGFVMQSIEAQSAEHAAIRGILEISHRGALPVVTEFTGVLMLETREVSLERQQPARRYAGAYSENGRVLTLREEGASRPLYLVHEETLAAFI